MASCTVNWLGVYTGSYWDGWLSTTSGIDLCIAFTTPNGSYNKFSISIYGTNSITSGTAYADTYIVNFSDAESFKAMSSPPSDFIAGGGAYITYNSNNTFSINTESSLKANTIYILVINVNGNYPLNLETYNISIAASIEYTVDYIYNDGNNGSTSKTVTSASHTVISTIPSYTGDYDTTTTFKITGDANGGDGGNKSVTASKRQWDTHTFLGWSKTNGASSASYTAGGKITLSGNITLYGVWKRSNGTTYSNNTLADLDDTSWTTSGTQYIVTLDPNSESASVSSNELKAGITTTHTFLGWNTDSKASKALADSTAYTSETTVYAVWKTETIDNSTVTLPTPTKEKSITYHTVVLDGNGGTTTTNSIDCPIETPYVFNGWSESASASSGIKGSYTPEKNVTLYATWSNGTPNYPSVTLPTTGLSRSSYSSMYTTTLVLNGGYHTKTSVETGTTTHYEFSHWASTSSGISVGQSISGTTYSKLYAIWNSSIEYTTASLGTPTKSISYKVTFDPSGGTISPTFKYVSGSYYFIGWYHTNDISGSKVANPYSYRTTLDNTLYAIWNSSPSFTGISLPTPSRSAVDSTFNVTLDANGGSLSSDITNPVIANSKTSFIFAGWSTVSGDKSNIITNTSDYITESDITLYAIWNARITTDSIILPTTGITKDNSVVTTYRITLDPMDGSVDPSYKDANEIRKYVFAGWSPTGNIDNTVSNSDYVPVSDIILKAVYNTADSINPVDLPSATKEDHTFLGWSIIEDGTEYVPTRYTTSGNETLYANYISNYRASLWIWYNGKWNKCIVNLFTGDRFNSAI